MIPLGKLGHCSSTTKKKKKKMVTLSVKGEQIHAHAALGFDVTLI